MAINAKRNAHVEITASSRKADREMRAVYSKIKKLKKDIAYFDKKKDAEQAAARKRMLGKAAGVGKYAAGAAFGVAGAAIAMTAREVVDFEKSMTRLQIASNSSDAEMSAFRESVNAVSRESGIAREEILGSAAAYVALTGDAKGARNSVAVFAKVANATGASMDDIANTAASMRDNLKIDPKDFEAAFSALTVQGKAGAVELKNLASELSGVAPSFSAFSNGSGVSGLIEMGSALQVIRKGFGSASEAATGMRALMVSIQRHADRFQKAGVKIYDKDPRTGKQRLREFSKIIDSINEKFAKRSPTELVKAFGTDEAKRAYDQLVLNRSLLNDLIQQGGDKGAIGRDAAKYQESAAARIEKAWNSVKVSMAEAFTTERIDQLASSVGVLSEKLISLVNHIAALFISEQQHRETLDQLAKRDREISKIQELRKKAGLSTDIESATAQYNTEYGQLKLLRQGGFDSRSSGDLLGQVARVSGGQFLKQDEFLAALSSTIAKAIAREISAPVAPYARMGQLKQAVPGLTNISVKVGTDTLAKGSAHAPAHRTRPGGM